MSVGQMKLSNAEEKKYLKRASESLSTPATDDNYGFVDASAVRVT